MAEPPSNLLDSTPNLEMDVLKGITIISQTIRKSKIVGCTFTLATIYESEIENSALINCKVFNSELRWCTAVESQLHEVEIGARCTIKGGEISYSLLAFRRFPPEVREMIFQRAINFKHTTTKIEKGNSNRQRVLLRALRCDRQLYPEAISVCFGLCWHRIMHDGLPQSERALRNVCKPSTMFVYLPLIRNHSQFLIKI